MKHAVDTHLRDQQADFPQERSCTDQIANLRIILEQSWSGIRRCMSTSSTIKRLSTALTGILSGAFCDAV
ncbi:hypothetical protein DPMN_184833 [Dreissena polymorpha]|uniref:Uncharacterized protein n=1 Tax=Dreissena polymorpha TaxID=45954 RepID=A0A9D4DJU2_DREPO|nr:hypothetical protein DPMN_184833 [Dreissena polymorpha]